MDNSIDHAAAIAPVANSRGNDVTLITPPEESGEAAPNPNSRSNRRRSLTFTHVAQLSIPIQDLNTDVLVSAAPRMSFMGRAVPSLGGIPLLAKLGQGGMGAVYYGVRVMLRQEVAVKVLPMHLAQQQPDLVERFVREAQIASKIASPHLVHVSDVNENGGLFFLVMELVKGVSTGAYLKQRIASGGGLLPEATALEICIAAATGLAAAHASGVIHRDVKPDNILLPRDERSGEVLFSAAKLADLGLARAEDMAGASLTGAQSSMGTPGFMAPEQALNARKAGKPADVFSMGAVLYALLSGHAPFKGDSATEAVIATIQKPHPPIGTVRPGVSRATAQLIDRCLPKRPEERYADAVVLLRALHFCRSALGAA